MPILGITGPDFDLSIESPLDSAEPADTSTLAKATAMVSRDEDKVERADKRPDGYVLVYMRSADHKYEVLVARPAFDVLCIAHDLDSRAEADAAAAVCETLRP